MTDSLARLTSIFESAKDLTIEAAVSASSRLSETPGALRPKEISKLLNSRTERDVLNGMKCVIAMMSQGEDVVPFFADIVKNITSSNQKVRNLVMLYTTRYAEVEPDTALLSINSIQKSLSDKSAISRAMAIKSMSDIRITSIGPILLLCIKRTISDKSPLVRASSALAIGKLFEIDRSNSKHLTELITTLLSDSSPQVVAASIKTYTQVFTHRRSQKKWLSIHGNFRRFCKLLVEFDEWTQGLVIDLLTDYCRTFISKPKLYLKGDQNQVIDLPDDFSAVSDVEYNYSFDSDAELFINSMKPLVFSNSPFVILAITRALVAIAPPKVFKEFNIASVLCRLANDNSNVQIALFTLEAIAAVCAVDSAAFTSYFKSFYPYPSDNIEVAQAKIDILTSLVDVGNVKHVLEELKYWALNAEDLSLASEAIKAIGKCSMISEEWNSKVLKWCLKHISSITGDVLNELLTVIRYLTQLKQNAVPSSNNNRDIIKIVYQLSLILADPDVDLEEQARASIIWIIGEFTKEANNEIGPDVLRCLIKTFADEPPLVRYETLLLAAKLYSIDLDNVKASRDDDANNQDHSASAEIISKMFHHVLNLSKYDPSYNTRDRARMINVLLNSGEEHSQLASLFLQVPKPAPVITNLRSDTGRNKVMCKYMQVADWADQLVLPSSSIRKEAEIKTDTVSAIGNSVVSSASKKVDIPNTTHAISSVNYQKPELIPKTTYKLQSLDEFFGSDEASSESESDSEDDDDEGEEDDEEEEYDDETEEESAEEESKISSNGDGGGDDYSSDDEEAEEDAPLTR